MLIKWFLLQCGKNYNHVITLIEPITTRESRLKTQSELESITFSRRQARENVCTQVAIGFGFHLSLVEKIAQGLPDTAGKQNQTTEKDCFRHLIEICKTKFHGI